MSEGVTNLLFVRSSRIFRLVSLSHHQYLLYKYEGHNVGLLVRCARNFFEFLQDKSQTYLLCLFFSLRKAEQVKQSVRFFALFHERT